VTVIFRPKLPDFQNSIAFWKVLAASQEQNLQVDEYGALVE